MKHLLPLAGLMALTLSLPSHAAPQAPVASADAVCADCVKAHMEHLAGDALRGRKCATADEHAASEYLEAELKKVGVAPGFGEGGYRQAVKLSTRRLLSPPVLEVAGAHFTHGREIIVTGEPAAASGPVMTLAAGAPIPAAVKGAIVFYDGPFDRSALRKLRQAGAAVVLVPARVDMIAAWDRFAASTAPEPKVLGADEPNAGPSSEIVMLKPEVVEALRKAGAGGRVTLQVAAGDPEIGATYNVMGVVHGSNPDADRHAILLSAHYDHLGVKNGVIFHGADDDASGTAAVLEFARIFGQGAKPRRTVYFAMFGCEESGGLGAAYFRGHTPTPLTDLAANLEFEMIGLRDPKYPDVFMLTGWERSNLGPTLAQHGAKLGPDHYPEQNFFQRSDNYQLALKGVVAQTMSGWPTPPTYHDASDDLAHVDLNFMDEVIGSMVGPVRWLADSDFQPAWNPGQKP
jgi:aminopeptidase YwaD